MRRNGKAVLNWWTNTDGEGSGHDRNDGAGRSKALVVVTYVVMVAVNFLANALPLNGRSTGAGRCLPEPVSPRRSDVRSIRGVIYLLSGLHVCFHQLRLFRGGDAVPIRDALLNQVGLLFSVSSLANTAWVFAWH